MKLLNSNCRSSFSDSGKTKKSPMKSINIRAIIDTDSKPIIPSPIQIVIKTVNITQPKSPRLAHNKISKLDIAQPAKQKSRATGILIKTRNIFIHLYWRTISFLFIDRFIIQALHHKSAEKHSKLHFYSAVFFSNKQTKKCHCRYKPAMAY